jgi:pre-60S factor REI1
MKSEWHRYNLKRKVLEIAPVTLEQFNEKLTLQAPKETIKQDYYCKVCKKGFKSENTLNSHFVSKKHIQLQTAMGTNEQVFIVDKKDSEITKDSFKRRLGMAKTESEIIELLDEKERNSIILSPKDCLFCPISNSSFEDNLIHMSKSHSFFIPDIENIVDLSGLIQYLGNKISVANVCIFCTGKGKMLHSLEATRDHMISKGHCKLPDFEDDEELYEFYDFDSNEWQDVNVDDIESNDFDDFSNSEVDKEYTWVNVRIFITDDDTLMVLKNGTKIGNRQYLRYFKQNIKSQQIVPGSMQDPEMLSRMSCNYKLLGYNSPIEFKQVMLRKKEQDLKVKQTKKFMMKQNDLKARVGVKHNMLQHHYREQNPF